MGADPTRRRCRGDKHRPGCAHLAPATPATRGRPRLDKRRSAALEREAQKRLERPLTAANPEVVLGDVLGVPEDHNTHENTPAKWGLSGTRGPRIHGATGQPVIDWCPRCAYAHADGGYCPPCGWTTGPWTRHPAGSLHGPRYDKMGNRIPA